MWVRLLLAAWFLLASACTRDWDRRDASASHPSAATTQASAGSVPPAVASRARRGFASLPDRGDLIAYPRKVIRRDGAYTWHRAEISEQHAMRAIVDGTLTFTAPSGETLRFAYERHVEHPTGDWTWFGRLEHGGASDDAIITFGERAVFGSIAQPGQEPLALTIRDGVAWIVHTDRAALGAIVNAATRPRGLDYLIPPDLGPRKTPGGGRTMASAPVMGEATPPSATVIDLVLGYTSGFAANLGGASAAVTRLNFLVGVVNESYVNSQIPAQVRLVHTLQVSYPDGTANNTTLEELTGYRSGTGFITPNPAFDALRAARDQYGADLVSLVRKFTDPENDGCGIAWLIGAAQSGIDANDEPFGYSVVGDGTDVGSDGKLYGCRLETLAHELGHNMGSQHDRETAKGTDGTLDAKDYGVYPYSFGYKTGAEAGNFYTVMAYGESAQVRMRIFSNPRINTCGPANNAIYPCGVENQADNARSLANTTPIVANFRATVVPFEVPPPNIFAIAKLGGSGTEAHVLNGATRYQSFALNVATALHRTGNDGAWKYQLGDYNRDGKLDLYVIAKLGFSSTEVHVLDGANNFQTFILHAATALHRTGSNDQWMFRLADYNRDGILDLYAINRMGGGGRTEVHVLNGANNFQSFLANIATALSQTGADGSWKFELGDFTADGIADLYCISKIGSSGTTEVHVLNGANAFQSFVLNTTTALHQTGSDYVWEFKLGDYNRDGTLDLYSINKRGGSGTTEVHILNGFNGFQSFLLNTATALHQTGSDSAWEFEVAR